MQTKLKKVFKSRETTISVRPRGLPKKTETPKQTLMLLRMVIYNLFLRCPLALFASALENGIDEARYPCTQSQLISSIIYFISHFLHLREFSVKM